MYDNVATLKAYGAPTFDEYGNEKHELIETEVYVQSRSVYSSEFYNAAQVGMKPSITLVMTNREDYDGQKLVEFEGVDYDIIRADWNAQRDSISLICEERIGHDEIGNDANASNP
jgi:SPP1 family predicted phage head-tail adaptor